MPYFLNTSNCDISYMGYTVQAGKVGYIEGSPLDARLVPANKLAEECEPQQSKSVSVKKRRRKQTRAPEIALDSASVESESVEQLSSSEDVGASTLQCSGAEEQQTSMQTDEVQLSQ